VQTPALQTSRQKQQQHKSFDSLLFLSVMFA
jgi:hypothetical protein